LPSRTRGRVGAMRRPLPQPLRLTLTRTRAGLLQIPGHRLTWLRVTLHRLTGLLGRTRTGTTRRSHHSARRRRSLGCRVLRGYALRLARGG
jgi:hypothetical protein